MKHKVLVNGRNQNMITDFFRQAENTFDLLSTSAQRSDIIGHFRFFQPEAYVIFLDGGVDQAVQQIADLKSSTFYNGAAIVVIGDADACNQLERRSRDFDLVIRRPATADNIAMRITRHLEDSHRERSSRAAFEEKTSQVDALIKAAEDALSSAAAANAPVADGGGRKHILVVDDDRTVLKMLKSALEGTYDVTTMANGAMIDKLLDAKKVDMIILDYEMPVETGAEIFKRLKKKPTSANIPVCFLTGVSDREKIMEVMSLKPHGYILKPIDMDALTSTIRSIIG